MNGGLFIALYDEESLKLYLKNGIYGFLMNPLNSIHVSSRSNHYSVLADYACSREGTEVFFFLKRKIYYGGKVKGNKDIASFYINGKNGPLGIKKQAPLFWDESQRYTKTSKEGVFLYNENRKSQPYILMFNQNENTGKNIISDEFYFKLGDYSFPLPSNSMQGVSFCTLTPGETNILKELITTSDNKIDYKHCDNINIKEIQTLFSSDLIDFSNKFVNEAQIEFSILATMNPLKTFLTGDYVVCRQIPISPFKPMNMDRADICLYDINAPIKNGTIPNIVIELKKESANFHAYEQVVRYLKWLQKITTEDEFRKIKAFVIAEDFNKIKESKVDTNYKDKIKLYSIKNSKFIELVNDKI
jgi:hypothetical protein